MKEADEQKYFEHLFGQRIRYLCDLIYQRGTKGTTHQNLKDQLVKETVQMLDQDDIFPKTKKILKRANTVQLTGDEYGDLLKLQEQWQQLHGTTITKHTLVSNLLRQELARIEDELAS